MQAFDWDRLHSGQGRTWAGPPNQVLVREVSELPPGRALDLATGQGRNAVWLAERGWTVRGVDFSPVALDKAERLAASKGVTVQWARGDLLRYAPERRGYDLVLVLYLHLPPLQMRRVLERASFAVAPGGVILVVGHHADNLEQGVGGPQDRHVLYTPEDVAQALPGLAIDKADRVVRTVQTDAGPAEAVDVVVRAHRPTEGQAPGEPPMTSRT